MFAHTPEEPGLSDRQAPTSEQPDLFKTVRALRKSGQVGDALALLRDALRRGQLDAPGIDQAGRFIQKETRALNDEARPLRILVLGQCTTSWLSTALTAVAFGHDVRAQVSDGGYDNILQDLAALQVAERPDVVVLLPWNQRLLGSTGASSARIANEIDFWQQAWDLIHRSAGARLLQVGYDWVTPGAAGHHLGGLLEGEVHLIREVNAALRQNLPPAAFFLDLEQVSGTMGRAAFYDPRRYYWTKQPFSEAGAAYLAKHLLAGVRALTTGPKKVLVLDLDNTLWGGVVGETGPLAIELGENADGEAYRRFQRHVKELTRSGCVLAVASKNNLPDAREPFEKNGEMILRLDDFAAFEASWEPKSVMLERIAMTLNLGTDSFVFFDDNPFEREQIRQALPEVEVVDVPGDPAAYVRALQDGLWFETTGVTDADRARAEQYAVERQRRNERVTFHSIEEYLSSLDMEGHVRPIDEADLPRVIQLLAKTNQFNLTTRRHTREEVLHLLSLPDAIGLTLRVKDRFGDYGLVSVVLAVPLDEVDGKTLRIDTWLMSCRVIARTVEEFFFTVLLDRSRRLGYRKIIGEYIPTKKNGLVKDLYPRFGFCATPAPAEEGLRFEFDAEANPPRSFVTLREPAV